MGKHNATGRSKSQGRFVQLHEYVASSLAWHRLSPLARCAWLEINFIYNGSNNGRLGVAARLLADRIGCTKSTASRSLIELQNWGFIECTKRTDRFNKKTASEYRLNHLPCDVTGKPASKKFMQLKKALNEETQ